MLTSPRLKEMLNLILEPPVHTAADLAERFGVTVRTIRSDIQALNRIMRGASIVLKRGKGYMLEVDDPQQFEDWKKQATLPNWNLNLDSPEDRQKYLFSLLLIESDWQNPDDLADLIYVSRNTIQGYLRNIRALCDSYGLTYESRGQQGIRITGPEDKRRDCLCLEVLDRNLTDYVTRFSPLETRLFEHTDLQNLSQVIYRRLQESGLSLSDYALKNLVLHTALMIERIEREAIIEQEPDVKIPLRAMDASARICAEAGKLADVVIPEAEKSSLAVHIALNTRMAGIAESEDLWQRVHELLEHIWATWRFDLRDDRTLQHDLYNHFYSIFQARTSGAHHPNPLLNTIKHSFPLPYDISLDAVNNVFHAEHLSEDEVGYISLHIGAAIERCYSGQRKALSVYIVCGSGMATSRMLEARLRSYFQNKLDFLGTLSYQNYLTLDAKELEKADFIISTVPLPGRNIPAVEVDFSLPRENVEAVARMMSPKVSESSGPGRFFQKELFIRYDQPMSKEQVLDDLAGQLVHTGIATPAFRESVRKRELLSNTNLNDVFAIPHPMTPQASQTRAAVAILNQPVKWNDKSDGVQIVFLLAFSQDDQHSIERLYDFLLEIVQSPSLQQRILQATSFEEFHKLCLKNV